jgi:hypothetical protein
VDPEDVRAMAEAHTLLQVAGPDRGRDALSEAVTAALTTFLAEVFGRADS